MEVGRSIRRTCGDFSARMVPVHGFYGCVFFFYLHIMYVCVDSIFVDSNPFNYFVYLFIYNLNVICALDRRAAMMVVCDDVVMMMVCVLIELLLD